MLSAEEFAQRLLDAYEHLYDLVYLRSHPFTEVLLEPISDTRKERAWELHYLLLTAIQELNPGVHAPTVSREWRRYRLMMLRYVDGLSPQEVADRLAISRRHYYRAHDEALQALVSILWQRYSVREGSLVAPNADPPAQIPADRLELLRLEAAQLSRAGGQTSIEWVLAGVLALLKEKLREQLIDVETVIAPETVVSVDKTLLRQLLLGVLGYLIEDVRDTRVRITALPEGETVCLSVETSPPLSANTAAFVELASVSDAVVERIPNGFRLFIPARKRQQSVLVIDDNPDVLELFQRYLALHSYEVSLAQNAQQALDHLKQIQPFAIILDLMMPDLDGWDLLQLFLNQPKTQSIPLIVCSVLKQKELALSMGATYFLEKPLSEQKLISVLELL